MEVKPERPEGGSLNMPWRETGNIYVLWAEGCCGWSWQAGRRSGRRAKRRFMDAVKEYMTLIGVRAASAED